MNMTNDEEKLSVNSWWAGTPEYALAALRRQLAAAAVIWPELRGLGIGTIVPPESSKELEATHETSKDAP